MAHTLVITGDAVCAGGDHLTTGFVFDGGAKVQRVYTVEQIRAPLSADDVESLRLLLLRAVIAGMTGAAAKSKLQSGVTVSIP